jgi:6-phosphogluconolactonase
VTASQSTLDYGLRGQVVVHEDAAALARAAAETFFRVTTDAIARAGRATVALSGGSTPKQMGELLATPPYLDQIGWHALELFWGDERFVPETDPDSNAGAARAGFLDHVPIPPDRIHPWPTVGLEPAAAATAYEQTLREVFGPNGDVPRFDLIFLGMGDDGHTASLFPETAALGERDALAVANEVPQLNTTRLTLTVPVLNAGRQVVFLAAGDGKAATLAAVLDGPERSRELPSQLVRPFDGDLTWLVDRAAAAKLARFEPGDG